MPDKKSLRSRVVRLDLVNTTTDRVEAEAEFHDSRPTSKVMSDLNSVCEAMDLPYRYRVPVGRDTGPAENPEPSADGNA